MWHRLAGGLVAALLSLGVASAGLFRFRYLAPDGPPRHMLGYAAYALGPNLVQPSRSDQIAISGGPSNMLPMRA